MKKLLIFMLVLGLASVANATLQISVMGDFDPINSEIFLAPSETLILDVWTDADISAGVGEGYWALSVAIVDGSVSGGVPLYPDVTVYDNWAGIAPASCPPGQNGVFGGVTMSTTPIIPAGSVIVDEIIFHCDSLNYDTLITLWADAIGTPVSIDEVIIHQIPEPMTIALLGLGGLFLRRRK